MSLTSSFKPHHSLWCAVLLLAPMTHALAAADRDAIQAQYNADVQRCVSLQEEASAREVCLQEAGAARQAALRGNLSGSASPADFQRNALARCQVHKDVIDRSSCERMALGEGASQGSVESGGLFKEMIVPVDPE